MPKRNDLKSILIIGAGPIVIGQACEFDYSGVQAVKALRAEGYRVILVNSNPATIMTDPEIADAVYIEPVRWDFVREVIAKERPDALLPTMGGQTALNCALDLVREGVLAEFGVELIGASRDAIDMAEDRERFKNAMSEIGLESPVSEIARTLDKAWTSSSASVSRPSSGPRSRWAARAAGLPTTPKNSSRSSRTAWSFHRPTKCCSRNRCWAGRNSRWRWCATASTTASSSARSRTSTRWAFIPAIRSRSHRPRP